MIKVYHIWSTNFPEFAQDVIDNAQAVDIVIFDCLNEIESVFFLKNHQLITERLFRTIVKHNIECVMLTISSTTNEWFQLQKYPVRVIDWPEFYFTFTYSKWQNDKIKKINSERGYSFLSDFNAKQHSCMYPYIFLNRKRRLHRAMVMDLLAKDNLLESGLVSWMQPGPLRGHKFNYWQEKQMTLDQKDHEFVQETVPVRYDQVFCHLVSETDHERIFITEKTVVPLLLYKPFLAVACPGFHENLKHMGFELYTELFDYGFDSEPDHDARFKLIVDNIKRVVNMPVPERREYIDVLQGKLIHNKCTAVNYARNIPDAVRNIKQLIQKNLPEYGWASLNILNNSMEFV